MRPFTLPRLPEPQPPRRTERLRTGAWLALALGTGLLREAVRRLGAGPTQPITEMVPATSTRTCSNSSA
jgi:hypothetical protein